MSIRVTRRGEPCLETVKVQMMLEVPSTLTPIGTRSATLDIGLAPASCHGPAVVAAAAAATAAAVSVQGGGSRPAGREREGVHLGAVGQSGGKRGEGSVGE